MPEIAWQYSTIYSYGEKQLVEGIPLSNSTEVAIYAIVITRKLQQSIILVYMFQLQLILIFSFFTRFDFFFSEIHSYWPRKWTTFIETALRTRGRNRPVSIKYHILDSSKEKLILQSQSIFKAKRMLNRYSLYVG